MPEAYETLLLDAMLGDPTLFARHDFVEASWALITPVHEAWAADTATADSDATRPASGGRPRPIDADAHAPGADGGRYETPTDRRGAVQRKSTRRMAQADCTRRVDARALIATVVAVGPAERLGRRREALEALGDAGMRPRHPDFRGHRSVAASAHVCRQTVP